MDIDDWNSKYAESVDHMQKRIKEIRGVVAAYNTNIDAIVRVKPEDLEEVLSRNPDLEAEVRKSTGEGATKGDLFLCLLRCIESGAGRELIITDRSVFSWIETNFRHFQLRMGGQAGNIANTLAKLNVPNVIAHSSSLPKAQASLFFDNVKIPIKKKEGIVLDSPINATRSSDEMMVHYVFEFDRGMTLEVDGRRIVAPLANRFVATWDPKNTRLDIDPAFLELSLEEKADRVALSGYHLLMRCYEDGTTHIDKIQQTVRQIKGWKKEDPELFIHLEMGDSKEPQIYVSTLNLLSPIIDCIGLNENELLKVSFPADHLGSNSPKDIDAVTIFRLAKMVLEYSKVPMILVHTMDFSLCILRKGEKSGSANLAENIQQGILFGALLAAARAVTGKYNDLNKVKKELDSPLLFVSTKGTEEHEQLAHFLEASNGASQKDFLQSGCADLSDCHVIFVASKLTEKTATTAGLGDSLVAGYLLGVR